MLSKEDMESLVAKVNNEKIKNSGDYANFGVIYKLGLGETDVKEFIEQATSKILNNISVTSEGTVAKITECVKAKFIELVCKIDEQGKTVLQLQSEVKEKFDCMQNNIESFINAMGMLSCNLDELDEIARVYGEEAKKNALMLDNYLNYLFSKLEDIHEDVKTTKEKTDTINENIESLRKEIRQNEENRNSSSLKEEEYKKQITEKNKQIEERDKQIADLRKKEENYKEQIKELEEQARAVSSNIGKQAQIKIAALQAELYEIQRAKAKQEQERSNAQREINYLEQERSNAQREINYLEQENAKLQNELKSLERKIELLNEEQIAKDKTQEEAWFGRTLSDIEIPEGVTKKIKRLYVRAKKGNKRAQFKLADELYFSENYKEAVYWYRQADNVDAWYALGLCYSNGRGVKKDYIVAKKYYEKAADKNDAYALNNLGVMYEYGKGVKVDEEYAVSLYRKAAKQGDKTACSNLANCYKFGIGTDVNLKEAAKWERFPSIVKATSIILQIVLFLLFMVGEACLFIYEFVFNFKGCFWIAALILMGGVYLIEWIFTIVLKHNAIIREYSLSVRWMTVFTVAAVVFSIGCLIGCLIGYLT